MFRVCEADTQSLQAALPLRTISPGPSDSYRHVRSECLFASRKRHSGLAASNSNSWRNFEVLQQTGAEKMSRKILGCGIGMLTATVALCGALAPAAQAQEAQKPNILFIMGDDIGWMQPSIYHEGLMVGETPNIDRIGHEGAKFMT